MRFGRVLSLRKLGEVVRDLLAGVLVVIGAHQVQPSEARLVRVAHLVQAVTDQVVNAVHARVLGEVLDQPAVQLDGRAEVFAWLGDRRLFHAAVGRRRVRQLLVARDHEVLERLLLQDRVALEVQLTQAKHRVGRVLGIARILGDEALEQRDGGQASFVFELFFSLDLARVVLVLGVALAQIFATQQRVDGVAIRGADLGEALHLPLELFQRGELQRRGGRLLLDVRRGGRVEESRRRVPVDRCSSGRRPRAVAG